MNEKDKESNYSCTFIYSGSSYSIVISIQLIVFIADQRLGKNNIIFDSLCMFDVRFRVPN